MAWLSLAERRLLVAHRSCICVAWGAVRHLPSCLALQCGLPLLGPSMVVHHLHPRVSADREDHSTLHRAGVDENDLACWGSSEAIALVDEPLVDEPPSQPSTDS